MYSIQISMHFILCAAVFAFIRQAKMDNHKSQDDYMEDPIEPQANRLPLSNETIEIDSGSVDLQDFDTASFPINDYRSMHSQLRGLSWRVPVLPNDCLETVLLACIRLAKSGKTYL